MMAMKSKNQLEHDLEKTDTWVFEKSETRGPVKSSRVIVSVAFSREDFTTISEYAKRAGKKTSEFIRQSSLEKATGQGLKTSVSTSGSTGVLWLGNHLPSFTLLHTNNIERNIEELVNTFG
jgi:hypothetical protein